MPWLAFWTFICLSVVAPIEIAVAQQPVPHPSPQRPPQVQQPTQTQHSAASPPAAPAAPVVQPGQAAQSNSPQRTTATYEDWIVQCETQTGSSPTKICDMTQVSQFQGKPFTRIAILRPIKDQARRIIVQVPVNVSFSTHVRVQINEADQGLDSPFARCTPNGCFAELELKDDTLKKLRSATGSGKLTFADSAGQNVAVPVSFNGFSPAYDALVAERE
jgi:invasion protein IalB